MEEHCSFCEEWEGGVLRVWLAASTLLLPLATSCEYRGLGSVSVSRYTHCPFIAHCDQHLPFAEEGKSRARRRVCGGRIPRRFFR